VRPTSITAFVHIVASHEELRRDGFWNFTIFELQTGFHYLSERNGIAGAAVPLISKFASKVITRALEIPPIQTFRYF
jgi:hypothetical protein